LSRRNPKTDRTYLLKNHDKNVPLCGWTGRDGPEIARISKTRGKDPKSQKLRGGEKQRLRILDQGVLRARQKNSTGGRRRVGVR